MITTDAQFGAITSIRSFPQLSIAVLIFGSGFPKECLQYETSCSAMCAEPRAVCLPFRCGNIVNITVTSIVTTTGELSMCDLNSVSPVLDDSILAFCDTTFQRSLAIDTSVLDPDSLNDPELGLYYDPQPTRARGLCNGCRGTSRVRGPLLIFDVSSTTLHELRQCSNFSQDT